MLGIRSFSALAISAASGIATVAALPTVIDALSRRQIIDVPNHRSSHETPTPRGGGVACAIGVAAGCITAKMLQVPMPVTVIGSSLSLSLVGYLDDLYDLPPGARLASQIMIGGVLGQSSAGWPGCITGAIVMPSVVNAVNFMDGINGISAFTLISWGAVLPAISQAACGEGLRGVGPLAVGVGAGFAPFNVPRARVFLGDVGSYLFGGLMAASGIYSLSGRDSFDVKGMLIVLSPLTYYLFDTGFTLTSRLARSERITEAHRDHIYQRLASLRNVEHWHVATGAGIAAMAAGAVAGRFDRGWGAVRSGLRLGRVS